MTFSIYARFPGGKCVAGVVMGVCVAGTLFVQDAGAFGFPYYGPGSGYGDYTTAQGAPPAAVVTQTSAYAGRYRNPYLTRNPALRGYAGGGMVVPLQAPAEAEPLPPALRPLGYAPSAPSPAPFMQPAPVPGVNSGVAVCCDAGGGQPPAPLPPSAGAYPFQAPVMLRGQGDSGSGGAPYGNAPSGAAALPAPQAMAGAPMWAPPSDPAARRRPAENPFPGATTGEALIDPVGPGEDQSAEAPAMASEAGPVWGYGRPWYR